jgi:hypothetical protein
MLPESVKDKARKQIAELEKELDNKSNDDLLIYFESGDGESFIYSITDLKGKEFFQTYSSSLVSKEWYDKKDKLESKFSKEIFEHDHDDKKYYGVIVVKGNNSEVYKTGTDEWENIKNKLHESKETKAEEKEEHKPDVITDKADVQKIKNSIQEGESILKSGKINGRKLSEGELESTLNSVNKSRAKIGLPKSEAKAPKFKIGDVVGLDLDERTPKKITSFKTNRKGEIIYSGYYIPFPDQKWNFEESELVLLKTPSKSESKKTTTRKAPVKAKEKAKKFKVGETVSIIDHPKSDKTNFYKVVGHQDWNDNYGWETTIEKADEKVTMFENLLEKSVVPKADHKKLVAKLKAKKGQGNNDRGDLINYKDGSTERRKRSESSDKKREALPLGKRVSADGNVYWENRLNRGDVSKEDKFEGGGEIKSSGWGLKFLKW